MHFTEITVVHYRNWECILMCGARNAGDSRKDEEWIAFINNRSRTQAW